MVYQPSARQTSFGSTVTGEVDGGKSYKVVVNSESGQQSFFVTSRTKIKSKVLASRQFQM
ncbi:hypothetical protein ACFO8Q_06240 [Effusibacillus consociatus]|uniref:Uncharacterized protein n=1 Tax=Effusibacillus consociatus TaxID=1117041 RepID=A0ABV9PZA9_9BACL